MTTRSALHDVGVTLLGGPTVVLDIAGLRLLTDPTFDPPGEHPVGTRSLTKTGSPAWAPEQVGAVAAVLLSHDQHPDNLDYAGRAFLTTAPAVFTTPAAAGRLGGAASGLAPWSSATLAGPDGGAALVVTAVPARHGPPGCEHLTGEVTGFLLSGAQLPTVYISGDNAALEHVEEVARRPGRVDLAVLFAGGAKTALLGDAYLTLSSAMAAEAAVLLGRPRVVVAHADGWAHFTEPPESVPAAFAAAGLSDVLVHTTPGVTTTL